MTILNRAGRTCSAIVQHQAGEGKETPRTIRGAYPTIFENEAQISLGTCLVQVALVPAAATLSFTS